MARNRAPRVLAYSDGISSAPWPVRLISMMVTLCDGRPRWRQGQAEWQKAVELTLDDRSSLTGCSGGKPGRKCWPRRAWRRFWPGWSAPSLSMRIWPVLRHDVTRITHVTLVTSGQGVRVRMPFAAASDRGRLAGYGRPVRVRVRQVR